MNIILSAVGPTYHICNFMGVPSKLIIFCLKSIPVIGAHITEFR